MADADVLVWQVLIGLWEFEGEVWESHCDVVYVDLCLNVRQVVAGVK
jgi:hypothetical protein